MNTDHRDDLGPLAPHLEPIAPPPGGLASLRERLAHEEIKGTCGFRRLALATACAGLLLVVGLVIVLGRGEPRDKLAGLFQNPELPVSPLAVSLGVPARPTLPMVSDPRIPPTDQVVFFWVQSEPAAVESPSEAPDR